MTPRPDANLLDVQPLESADRFAETYREVVAEVLQFLTPQMQLELSRHNAGWRPGLADFRGYLSASVIRYRLAYHALGGRHLESLCDVGGFWGAFPVTAKRLGVGRVALTEALKYYSDSFDRLFEFVSSEGVEVIDFDPFGDEGPSFGKFDGVSLMAVLEHYPHSPERPLSRVAGLLEEKRALLHIEVPNIAYLPKRVAMLRGRSPLVPIGIICDSDEPFTGHHHEYTYDELISLCSRCSLEVVGRWAYNYSMPPTAGRRVWADLLKHSVSELAYRASPRTREVLAVTCRRNRESRELLDTRPLTTDVGGTR